MKTLDEIKRLMAEGETAKADTALKELLDAEPNNLQVKMLYGTCRQLLGDEETFRRIHDELTPVMGTVPLNPLSALEVRMWENYHREWEMITKAPDEMKIRYVDMSVLERIKYGGPPYYRRKRIRKQVIGCLLKLIGLLFLFWFAWWLGQRI